MPLLPIGGDLTSWVPVEIGTGWISFAGDQRYLYSVRWRSALFGLGERKRMEGQRGRENRVSGYWGRVMKKKRKGDVYVGMVLRQWVRYGSHKK